MTLTSQIDHSVVLSYRNSLRSCTRCPLHQSCTAPVPWYGDIGSDIAIIGEAPGQQEDKHGAPFVGSAGILLKYALKGAGIDPATIAYTNSVQCYPHGTPEPWAIDACNVWMRGQIAFVRPRYVITVGVIALDAVRGTNWPKLREIHGKPLYWDNPPPPAGRDGRIVVWPTYHPAAALRRRSYKRLIEDDLAAFVKWRTDGELWPEECCVCGDELHRYDAWGQAFCERHAMRQGLLFPEVVK